MGFLLTAYRKCLFVWLWFVKLNFQVIFHLFSLFAGLFNALHTCLHVCRELDLN